MAKKKILIIEDEVDQVLLLRTRLEANGYEIVSAFDGKEGLKKVADTKPDLILLDIMLPGIDGFYVFKRLKDDPKYSNIPVIIITAVGDPDIEKKSAAIGADACIRKPYESEDLVEKVKKLIKSSGGKK
ncbi:MAG: response regulator [Candidatus Omnitrophica bacterium]|nr:response regulator [Candidatus Omnitrophota bacterium]